MSTFASQVTHPSARLVGLAALTFSTLYFASDVMEHALVGDLEPWVTLHGLLMVVAGSALGIAVIRAQVLPRWTGMTLVAGVVLVALSSVLPDVAQTICAGVRDLGFAGMGLFLLTTPTSSTIARSDSHVPA